VKHTLVPVTGFIVLMAELALKGEITLEDSNVCVFISMWGNTVRLVRGFTLSVGSGCRVSIVYVYNPGIAVYNPGIAVYNY